MEPRKRKRTTGFWLLIAAIAVGLLAAGLMLFFHFFSVESVEVQGNVRYTDEEITDLCMNSPLAQNTVLFSVFQRTIDLSDHAFLEKVTVEYVDRNTIRLNVAEKVMVGMFEVNGYYYYFDQEGRVTEVLSAPDEEQKDRVPLITGLGAEEIGLEHVIRFDHPKALNTITAIRSMIEKNGVCPDSVEFDADLNVTLHYGGVSVLLGQDVLLEEKMARAAAILPNLKDYSGTLHLENFSLDTENIVFDIAEEEAEQGAGADPETTELISGAAAEAGAVPEGTEPAEGNRAGAENTGMMSDEGTAVPEDAETPAEQAP